jgi:hypothetical protein
MSSVFVLVQVEDATVESLSAGLQLERVTSDIERAVRQTLDVPAEKRVMVEPFRNGVVLSVGAAQTVEKALDDWLKGIGRPPRHDELTVAAREALEYVRAGLEVIQGHGG